MKLVVVLATERHREPCDVIPTADMVLFYGLASANDAPGPPRHCCTTGHLTTCGRYVEFVEINNASVFERCE